MTERPAKTNQNITRLLHDLGNGNTASLDQLTPLIYNQLHDIANNAFRGERADHTLQTTALVHEAYTKLVDADVDWQDRRHFFSLTARMMRRILVDHAKGKNSQKRGSGAKALSLDDAILITPSVGEEILDLHEALNKLSEKDERKSSMLELHYFAGLTYEEIGNVLSVSQSTLERDMRFAKAWLKNQLEN